MSRRERGIEVIVELRELSLDDGRDVFDMIREVGPGESGFVNSGHDLACEDFPVYLRGQADMSRGIGLDPTRHVPETRYWLFVDGRPVGIGKLRHYLNDSLKAIGGHIGYTIRPSERRKGYGNLILRELLREARKKGIKEALLTCDEDNLPSRKIMERNGGELESISEGKCRYWIRCG